MPQVTPVPHVIRTGAPAWALSARCLRCSAMPPSTRPPGCSPWRAGQAAGGGDNAGAIYTMKEMIIDSLKMARIPLPFAITSNQPIQYLQIKCGGVIQRIGVMRINVGVEVSWISLGSAGIVHRDALHRMPVLAAARRFGVPSVGLDVRPVLRHYSWVHAPAPCSRCLAPAAMMESDCAT